MKSEFKAKYLQHLLSKKQNNEGFTLIELLVVIIIVGVLAAIALPSFLSQISRARASEGVTNVGSINRAQQIFRYQNTAFTNDVTSLDARITAKYYTYDANGASATSVDIRTTTQENDLKAVAGRAEQNSSNQFNAVVCIATDIATSGTASAATTSAIVGAGVTSCAGNNYSLAR
jgi:type IV pilus assembly protein PilA